MSFIICRPGGASVLGVSFGYSLHSRGDGSRTLHISICGDVMEAAGWAAATGRARFSFPWSGRARKLFPKYVDVCELVIVETVPNESVTFGLPENTYAEGEEA
jgi:hypothetical protein